MEVPSSVDDKNGDVDSDVGLVVLWCLRSNQAAGRVRAAAGVTPLRVGRSLGERASATRDNSLIKDYVCWGLQTNAKGSQHGIDMFQAVSNVLRCQ